MSEDPTPYGTVISKVLQLACAPFSPAQAEVWHQNVDAAYRTLSHTPAFHKVLEHWTVTVLMNAEAEEGARRLIIEICQSMNTLNTLPQMLYQEDRRDVA